MVKRSNTFSYIIKRVIIGVLISIILMFLKTNVFALGNTTIPPTSQTFYYATGAGQSSPTLTQFTRSDAPNISWYGINLNQSGQTYYQIRYNFNLSSISETGLYNIDFLFYNNWNGYLLNQFTFAIYSNGGFYTCTSNDSNTATDSELVSTPKYVIGVQCDNVYVNNNDTGFYVLVNANGTTSYGDRVGISRLNFVMNAFTSGAAEISNAVSETNETIKDDSIDTSKADSDISSMNNKVASNGTITQLLTLPITLFQSVLNSVGGSCSSFSLGSMFNHEIVFPCINLSNILGSTLYNIIDILLCGSFILVIRKKFVDIFNHMTSLNDRGNEVE